MEFERLQQYLIDKYDRFKPSVLVVSGLFDEGFVWEYLEIISLMFTRLVLEAAEPEAPIRLDVADFVEDLEEARALHSTCAEGLVEKLMIYNRAFSRLLENEADPRNAYVAARSSQLLADCDAAETPSAKDTSLESLVETLFAVGGQLEVQSKNLVTGDEELDLVLKNNVDRPFWIALNSPLILVECKNWSSSVGASHIRDFETKVRNHSPMVRVGFFVALNGFTSEAKNALKRGREDHHIALIDRASIQAHLDLGGDVLKWLEENLSQVH